MKNIIYTLGILLIVGIATINAQDISLTNTKLDPPATGQTYGQACFTIIAEDGIELTTLPLAVEISISKMNFDLNAISGFNSDRFNFEVDAFSNSVLRGTLVSSVADVDNGEGGAQICIPVNSSDYSDSRNGFLVNIVSGGYEQNGSTDNDNIQRFGFSQNYQKTTTKTGNTSLDANMALRDNKNIEISVFPNPATNFINIESSLDIQQGIATVYNGLGQVVYLNNSFQSYDQINVQKWNEGVYFIELRNNADNVIKNEKVVLVK